MNFLNLLNPLFIKSTLDKIFVGRVGLNILNLLNVLILVDDIAEVVGLPGFLGIVKLV